MLAAAEAVEEALLVVDGEGRRLLVVERAEAGVLAPDLRFSETLRPTTSDRLRRARSSSRKPGGKAMPQMYTE